MRALRPASNSIRNRVSSLGIFPSYHVWSETAMSCYDGSKLFSGPSSPISDLCYHLKTSYSSNSVTPSCPFWKHYFFSQGGTKSSGEEDSLESGDDETSESFDRPSKSLLQKELYYNHVLVESELYNTIRATPFYSLDTVLDKWVNDGKEITREDKVHVMFFLQESNYYEKALKFSMWMEKSKKVDFEEADYARRVTLIGMYRNIQSAERYVESIPSCFRGKIVYQSLLRVCVFASNVRKSREIFNKMIDLKLGISMKAVNKLLALCTKFDKEKIPGLLLWMDRANVKPTKSTYGILLDAKGRSNDIKGMEKIYEKMKGEGMKPGFRSMSVLFKHYLNTGFNEKAEGVLKEMEDIEIHDSHEAFRAMLPLYADLGNGNEVRRLWMACQPDPMFEDYLAGIKAWGKLKNFEEAEALFEDLTRKTAPSARASLALMDVYLQHSELSKAKGFMKVLIEKNWPISPSGWDVLVRLFMKGGELERADVALQRAISVAMGGRKWFSSSFLRLMEGYARRGDVHNCERIFQKSRKTGQPTNIIHFLVLLRAYSNSQKPAYGILERMKAEGLTGPFLRLREKLQLSDSNIAGVDLVR